MLAELFSRNLTLRAERKKIGQILATHQRQLIEANAVIGELRNEVALAHQNALETSRFSAVDSYRLARAERQVETMRRQLSEKPETFVTSSGKSKSELFRIDVKFTGEDNSLNPSFQRQIRIALAQNHDRY